MKQVTINREQQLFVIPEGNGYSCLGFDVCRKWTLALELELIAPNIIRERKLPRKDSLKAYQYYCSLIEKAKNAYTKNGWRSTSQLYGPFIGNEGKRVEVIYNDGTKERFTIGKSTGFIPCHLMIKTSRSLGGESVLNDFISSFKFV